MRHAKNHEDILRLIADDARCICVDVNGEGLISLGVIDNAMRAMPVPKATLTALQAHGWISLGRCGCFRITDQGRQHFCQRDACMNKEDLIKRVAESAGVTKAAAERCVAEVLAAIAGSVSEGKTVTLAGFGTFELASRAARRGRNPGTGESVEVPAKAVPKFKPSSAFKQAVATSQQKKR